MTIECSPIVIGEIKMALINAIEFCMRENKEDIANRYTQIYQQIHYICENNDFRITII